MTSTAGQWYGLHWADWLVLVGYLLGITVIGVWSYKKVSDASDFFIGGRRFGKIFMMFFAFGAGTSSEQAVSVVASSFRYGLAGIWYQFLWLWATPFYWILAPVFRRMRALTTSDFFEARYDTSTATLYSFMGIAISIVFIAGALFGSGRMVEGLSDGQLNYNYTIAAMTVMFLIYGLAGGLGAAIITDFIQGVLTIAFSILLLPFVLSKAGGFAGLEAPNQYRPDMLNLTLSPDLAQRMGEEPMTVFYVAMLSISALAGIVVQPHIMGVCGAGKTEFEGRFGFVFGNFLKRFCTIAWAFTGLACIVIYMTDERAAEWEQEGQRVAQMAVDTAIAEGRTPPSAEELERIRSAARDRTEQRFADELFGKAARDILPTIMPGLVGLLLASLLAAVMSTCDAQMVVSSGLFTENIYKRFLVRDASRAHYLWVGRIAGFLIVVLALLLQTQFTNVVHALKTYILAVPAFIGLSFWIGIVWRGFTPLAVWASTLTGAATWFLTTKHLPMLGINIDAASWEVRRFIGEHLPFMTRASFDSGDVVLATAWQYTLFLGAGLTAGIVVSLVTPRTPEAKLDHFFKLIRTPVRKGEKVDAPCTLPEDHLPTEEGKLLPFRDIEIPIPSMVGLVGFLVSWLCVFGLIWLTRWLAGQV